MKNCLEEIFTGTTGLVSVMHDICGTTAMLVIVNNMTYNPANNQETVSDISYPVKIVIESIRNNSDRENGTLVEGRELSCTIAAAGLNVIPHPGKDKIIFNGQVYSIMNVEKLFAGNLHTAWKIKGYLE